MKAHKIILFALLMCIGASAQRRLSPEMITRMNNKKWEFIVQKVKLTEQEAQQVRPIFDTQEIGLLNLYTKEREKRMKIAKGEPTEKDYATLNEYGISMERKKLKLLENAHQQLSQILSAKKLFLYNQANREFRRQLFDKHKKQAPKQ